MRAPSCLVVGIDTSAESLSALEWALVLSSALGSRLIVIHAVGLLEEGGYRERPDVAAIVGTGQQHVPGASRAHVEIVQEDGPAADVIVRVAEREQADVIVVGSRGLGKAPRLLGSVSEAVLAHAHIPVLIVPA